MTAVEELAEDGDHRLRGAIVGFGTIAQGHMVGYRGLPDVTITAVVDPAPSRRDLASALMPGVRTFGSIDDFFREADVDFVDICCPPAFHAEYLCRALDDHIPALCEKPVVTSPAELRLVLRSVDTTNAFLFPCHNYKYAPAVVFMRDVIGNPEFGSVVSGHLRTYRSGHAVGVPEWNPHWRRDLRISGGGIIQDHGWHSTYVAMNLLGRPPVAVSCLAGTFGPRGFQHTEDTALMTLHFDHDVRVLIELSWSASFRETTYLVVGTNQSVFVNGDRVVHVKAGGNGLAEQTENCHIRSEFNDSLHGAWFRSMFGDFRSALADPGRRMRDLDEVFVTTSVVDAAYRSAATGGHPVPFDQTLRDVRDGLGAKGT